MSQVKDLVESKATRLQVERPDQTVKQACERMHDLGMGALVILNDVGEMLGVFNERCVSFKLIPKGLDPATTPVSAIMKCDQPVVSMNADVDSACALMLAEQVRYLVVVDDEHRPVHVISMTDIQSHVAERSRMTLEYLSSRTSLMMDA